MDHDSWTMIHGPAWSQTVCHGGVKFTCTLEQCLEDFLSKVRLENRLRKKVITGVTAAMFLNFFLKSITAAGEPLLEQEVEARVIGLYQPWYFILQK